MNSLVFLVTIFLSFGITFAALDVITSNSVEQLKRRIEFLERRFSKLSVRCSEIINLKRGYPGPVGKQGIPGRDGLGGLPGRDGAAGRDGRDCPCQNRDFVEYYGTNYANAFSGRSKRTVGRVFLKNVTVTRFGRSECPEIKGVQLIMSGRATIDYNNPRPEYECSPLHEVAVPKKTSLSDLFPNFDIISSTYSVKYRTNQKSRFPTSDLEGTEVSCAKCMLPNVETTLMLQGVSACPDDWDILYEGFLMSENWNHIKSENICVDKEAQKSNAPHYDGLSATLSSVHASCHGKACGTDMDDTSVKCVVCVLHGKFSK